ncbi:MAG: cupin domain-containing protein [Anaerolineales bacterium]
MGNAEFEVLRAEDSSKSVRQQAQDLENSGHSFYRWSNAPGDTYQAHEHSYHKVIIVERGSITFHLPEVDESVTLAEGDRLDLPAGVLHSAEVGSSGVACLESHLL